MILVVVPATTAFFLLRPQTLDRARPGANHALFGGEVPTDVVVRRVPRRKSAPDGELGVLSTVQTSSQEAARQGVLDARTDGWETEAFAAAAQTQLGRIAKLFEHPEGIDQENLSELVADDFSCPALRPGRLVEAYRDRAIVVRRQGAVAADEPADMHRGPAGLADALRALRKGLAGCSGVRAHFKLFRVDPAAASTSVTAYYDASGRRQGGSVQQNAAWDVRLTAGSAGQPPRLMSIEVHDFEEVVATSGSGTLFADCTEAVLAANPSYREQLSYGADHWMQCLEDYLSPGLLESLIGLAVGDVNGDSLEDLYVCQPAGLPNRLFVQNPDGTVSDATVQAGVDILDFSHSALLVDLDNDGDQDLAVLTSNLLLIFANDGQGRFALQAKLAGENHRSLTAADCDLDGDLDLYVCSYSTAVNDLSQYTRPNSYYAATNGGRNALLRNDGGWRFSDATAATGLDDDNNRWSFAAAWEDYDNDGDLDLYVANDFGHNNLYRNDGGTFTDVAEESGAQDANFGMAVTWGDYNRDGWMDVYVSNMFSSAGNRITFQPQFRQEKSGQAKAAYQRLARGNTLLVNAGDGTFRDASVEAGVTMGRWAWSSLFADMNNDGWDDLLVANGYLTQDIADDL